MNHPSNENIPSRSFSYHAFNFTFLLLLAVFFISLYTVALLKSNSRITLSAAVERNISCSDAVHRAISSRLTRADFEQINTKSDMSSAQYRSLQSYLNELRSLNSTRYLYTAKRGPGGKPIYLIDGLDLEAPDFAYPGTYLEEEMVPYLEAALSGKTIHSQKIIDTTWGHIFTACYPVIASDGTNDILGALCIEIDMEDTYRSIEAINRSSFGIAAAASMIALLLIVISYFYTKKQKSRELTQQQLLEQTAGRGVNVYTHSEMLPAHGYPELKRRYPHLKGNFGTAWQNQQREFEDIPAPILFTTNCIMPLRASYADRVFTTSVVAYPGVPHIDEGRDFSPVIEKALELGGYAQDTLLPGLNGGSTVTTGFARTAVLQHADEIVQAVRDGKLRHFFLVGGCDGTRPSRRYYTEFARLTPPDTILLTLACGKFRLNDLPLGTVPGTGLPRILDVGQCNDAYSAIRIALALADAFGCGVNDLPLSLVLCWFEQKAVCILIALLALGIRNIRLGPTLPPFLSPGVVRTLQERYGLKPIATPEADLQAILGG